jgi:hypothetical protein
MFWLAIPSRSVNVQRCYRPLPGRTAESPLVQASAGQANRGPNSRSSKGTFSPAPGPGVNP